MLSLAMVGFIGWAILAIRARNVRAHRAAMLRAYAIGQGASTQTALFLLTLFILKIEPFGLARDILMLGAWVINLAVADLLIRRPLKQRAGESLFSVPSPLPERR
jgi:hypothetical protein